MPERSIPCVDCDSFRHNLENMGFKVSDCTHDPSTPDFCIVTFNDGSDGAIGEHALLGAAFAAAPRTPPAGPTATQKSTAMAIVNIFESGSVLGDYGQVTVLTGDSGHLTFGRSQTSLGSGNLSKLVDSYCALHGASMAALLEPYLPNLHNKSVALDADSKLKNILRASADDHLMRDVQDDFFERIYWQPALSEANRLGITTPLGVATVYDSFIHGSWTMIRDRTTKECGSVTTAGEKKWIAAYIGQRLDWLTSHKLAVLRATRYRMDTLKALVDAGKWGLELPLVIRGQEVSMATLGGKPGGCYDGPVAGSRALAVQAPLARGADVRKVQLVLSLDDIELVADGIYGSATAQLIKNQQKAAKLPETGVADPSLIAALLARKNLPA